jgi:diadenosine tetraphosphatase ApaH/serine/threonine PP2A family protein phosphatase
VTLALVADLHANREAVTAVFAHADAEGAERFAFLGDFVGYGADPGWVVDAVRERIAAGAIAVAGNHDAAVVRGPLPTMTLDARTAVTWTRARLDHAQLAFLAGLPLTATDDDSLFVHANAWAPGSWEYIGGRADAARSLLATDRRMTFCGHVHVPTLYHQTATGKTAPFFPAPGIAIPLSEQRRWLAIPGSAGQPRDGNPAACYAMFDPDARTVVFHRVPYDHERAAAKVRAAGLPQDLADRLRDGT